MHTYLFIHKLTLQYVCDDYDYDYDYICAYECEYECEYACECECECECIHRICKGRLESPH